MCRCSRGLWGCGRVGGASWGLSCVWVCGWFLELSFGWVLWMVAFVVGWLLEVGFGLVGWVSVCGAVGFCGRVLVLGWGWGKGGPDSADRPNGT